MFSFDLSLRISDKKLDIKQKKLDFFLGKNLYTDSNCKEHLISIHDIHCGYYVCMVNLDCEHNKDYVEQFSLVEITIESSWCRHGNWCHLYKYY